MKYYFITYRWVKHGQGHWEKSNVVVDKHPVEWLKHLIDNFEDTYQIEFYDEITKEQYDLINGWIN